MEEQAQTWEEALVCYDKARYGFEEVLVTEYIPLVIQDGRSFLPELEEQNGKDQDHRTNQERPEVH